MAVPQRKVTRTRKAKRNSHSAVKKINLFDCKKCGKKIQPHRVCGGCGYYKNRKYINIEA